MADLDSREDDVGERRPMKFPRTQFCKHKGHCSVNAVKAFVSWFLWTFKVKYGIAKAFFIVSALLKRKMPSQILTKLFSPSYNWSHIEFSIWLGLMNAVYKIVNCISRWGLQRLEVADPCRWSAPIAGFFAGLCLRVNSIKKQRNFIMSLLMSRLLDTVLNKLVQDAYKSKENEERQNEGDNRHTKNFIIMTLMILALIHNLFTMIYYPNLNNPDLVKNSLRYCVLSLDDGVGFIVKSV